MNISHGNEEMLVTYYSESEVGKCYLSAFIRRVDFQQLCTEIKNLTDEVRAHMRRSAVDALETAACLGEGEHTAVDVIGNVGIWFAYEVADGRATFNPDVEYIGLK